MINESERITILNREFDIACHRDEKPALRRAADFLDQEMRSLRDQGASVRSFDQLLVVVALNLYHQAQRPPTPMSETNGATAHSANAQHERNSLSAKTLERLIQKIDEAMS